MERVLFICTTRRSTLFDKQTAPDTLDDQGINSYAAGLFIDSRSPGKPVFLHSGATNAYRSKLIASPSEKLSVAWLSNTSMLDTAGVDFAAAVFDIFSTLNHRTIPNARPSDPIKLDPKKLRSYCGLYKSAQSDRNVEITSDSKSLFLSETPLEPINQAQFLFFGIKLSFGPSGELAVTVPNGEPMRYLKVDSIARDIPLNQYAGNYFSKEVGADVEILCDSNTIKIRTVSGNSYSLQNYSIDKFLAPDLKADLTFKRDKKKRIKTLEISTQRSLWLSFEKQKFCSK